MAQKSDKILLHVSKWLVLVVVVTFLFGGLQILAQQAFFQFLPDPDWTSKTGGTAWLVAIASSFGALALILISRRLRKRGLLPQPKVHGKTQLTLFGQILCATLLMLPAGHMSVTIGIPFAITALVGEPGQATFIIRRSRKPDGWRCRRPVEFEELPFLVNEICGVSDAFRISVFPGSKVQVSGRATSLGIFPKTLTKLD